MAVQCDGEERGISLLYRYELSELCLSRFDEICYRICEVVKLTSWRRRQVVANSNFELLQKRIKIYKKIQYTEIKIN